MQKNLTELECYLSGIDSLGYATTFPENEEKTIENIIVHTDEGDLSLKAFIQNIYWVRKGNTATANECIKMLNNLNNF